MGKTSAQRVRVPSRGSLTPEGRPDCRSGGKLREIGNKEAAVVRILAGNADAVPGGRVGSVPGGTWVKSNNARSPVTAWSDRSLVINLQDNGAIGLNVCEVLRVRLRLVLDISVSRVGTSEEIPVTGST